MPAPAAPLSLTDDQRSALDRLARSTSARYRTVQQAQGPHQLGHDLRRGGLGRLGGGAQPFEEHGRTAPSAVGVRAAEHLDPGFAGAGGRCRRGVVVQEVESDLGVQSGENRDYSQVPPQQRRELVGGGDLGIESPAVDDGALSLHHRGVAGLRSPAPSDLHPVPLLPPRAVVHAAVSGTCCRSLIVRPWPGMSLRAVSGPRCIRGGGSHAGCQAARYHGHPPRVTEEQDRLCRNSL
jgi:hypothetical protein